MLAFHESVPPFWVVFELLKSPSFTLLQCRMIMNFTGSSKHRYILACLTCLLPWINQTKLCLKSQSIRGFMDPSSSSSLCHKDLMVLLRACYRLLYAQPKEICRIELEEKKKKGLFSQYDLIPKHEKDGVACYHVWFA